MAAENNSNSNSKVKQNKKLKVVNNKQVKNSGNTNGVKGVKSANQKIQNSYRHRMNQKNNIDPLGPKPSVKKAL